MDRPELQGEVRTTYNDLIRILFRNHMIYKSIADDFSRRPRLGFACFFQQASDEQYRRAIDLMRLVSRKGWTTEIRYDQDPQPGQRL